MPLFEADEQTQAIVIYTEPGGRMEAELARLRDREQLAAADRRVHGGQVHGRDARHELRPRRHDRRGQGRHGRARRSRACARPASRSPRRSPRSPTSSRSGSARRWRRERAAAPKALFIDVEVDEPVARDPELARKLAEVCPVDIFAQNDDGTLEIVEENLDECVLCYLCVEAAPGREDLHRRGYAGVRSWTQAHRGLPVDIFASTPTVRSRLSKGTSTSACSATVRRAAPAGTVRVIKLYE